MRGFKKTLTVDADNPVVGDFHLTAGDMTSVDGDDATPQELRSRFLLVKGSSFTDLREGVPYFTDILIKGYDPGRVRSVFRQTILSHPAIVDVPRLTLSVNSAREASVAYEARTVLGTVIRSEDFGPVTIVG